MISNLTSNLFIRKLPASITEDEFKGKYKKFGKITSIKLNKREGSDTCVGYVSYEKSAQAQEAIYQTSLSPPFGQEIVDYYKPKQYRQKEQMDTVGQMMMTMMHSMRMPVPGQNPRGGFGGHRGMP